MRELFFKKWLLKAALVGLIIPLSIPTSYCSEITYEQKSRESFLSGNYKEARDLALKALNAYENPKNRNTTEARERLLDAYEALGQKEEFLEELKWLRKKARTETRKKLLDARKKGFLKKYSL